MVEQQVSAFEISLGDSTVFGRCQCEIRRRFSFGELFHSCHAVCVHPAEIARFQPFGQCLVKPARLLGRGVRQLGYPVDQQVQASVRIGRFVGFSQHILPFYAGIAVVKLKEAKRYLREFFFIPEGVPAFQETDLMMAVSYLNGVANVLNMPLVICLALGNSMGGHGTDGPLPNFLNYISTRRRRSIVTATGNEANTRHHFQGALRREMDYEDVEISVEQDLSLIHI